MVATTLPSRPQGSTGISSWSPEKRVLAGLAAIVVLELLEDAIRLRSRTVRALTLRLQDWDATTSRGLHRSEVGMFMAGLSGARRHHR
jgi:hypothetical protein